MLTGSNRSRVMHTFKKGGGSGHGVWSGSRDDVPPTLRSLAGANDRPVPIRISLCRTLTLPLFHPPFGYRLHVNACQTCTNILSRHHRRRINGDFRFGCRPFYSRHFRTFRGCRYLDLLLADRGCLTFRLVIYFLTVSGTDTSSVTIC